MDDAGHLQQCPEEHQREKITGPKRQRPGTKATRNDCKRQLERAILLQNSPVLPLFSLGEDGNYAANLDDLLTALNLKSNMNVSKLSPAALRNMSHMSNIFNIRGPDSELTISFHPKVREDVDDKTVYVDNLPPQCSEARLRRRAAVFGNVINVSVPQIPRMQKRLKSRACQNSGFAFVQFATKTGARRFCKKYQHNSHLKRPKHKSNKKRVARETSGASQNDEVTHQADDLPCAAEQHSVVFVRPSSASFSTPREESAPPPAKRRRRRTSSLMCESFQSVSDVSVNVIQCSSSLVTVKRDSTECVSVASMDESGTESELDHPSMAQTSMESSLIDLDSTKKKKRCRHRRQGMPAISLTNMLSRIQVFPMRQYRELRSEYLSLKKEGMRALKAVIKNGSYDAGTAADLPSPNEQVTSGSSPDSQRAEGQNHKRKRRRTRGKNRLLRMATNRTEQNNGKSSTNNGGT